MRMKDIKADGTTLYAYQRTSSYARKTIGRKVVVLDKGLRRIVFGEWRSRLSDTEDGVLVRVVDSKPAKVGFRKEKDTRTRLPKDREAGASVLARYPDLPDDQLIVQAREIAGEWEEHEAMYRKQEERREADRQAQEVTRKRDEQRVEALKEALGVKGVRRGRYHFFELSREAVDAVLERLGVDPFEREVE